MVVAPLRDPAELNIVGIEKDIADKIMDDPAIVEPGLRITRRKKDPVRPDRSLRTRRRRHPGRHRGKARAGHHQRRPAAQVYMQDVTRGNPAARVRGILCAPQAPRCSAVCLPTTTWKGTRSAGSTSSTWSSSAPLRTTGSNQAASSIKKKPIAGRFWTLSARFHYIDKARRRLTMWTCRARLLRWPARCHPAR